MTTETKTDNTSTPAASDNTAVFAPLGKYAVIAVIMVSIIVTTAIMLDKQLNTVEEKLAAIENEITPLHTDKSTIIAEEVTIVTKAETINEVVQSNDEQKSTDIAQTATIVNTVSAKEPTPVKATETTTQTTATPESKQVAKAITETVAETEIKTTKNTVQINKTQPTTDTDEIDLSQKRQIRINALKLDQKQRMTGIFARIKALESKQLDQYKANQEKQIVRLRQQITQQQQMIEALVLRNEDLFKLRAANVQRNQSNREKMLNRI